MSPFSDEDDSDLEEKAAYEAAQVHAAMGRGQSGGIDLGILNQVTHCFTLLPLLLALCLSPQRHLAILREDNNAADTDDWDAVVRGEKEVKEDTRLVRDDEDFAEGLHRRYPRHPQSSHALLHAPSASSRALPFAPAPSKAAYEAAQVHAAMGRGQSGGIDRPKTPPKVTSLPINTT
jgi:hypothetical protein